MGRMHHHKTLCQIDRPTVKLMLGSCRMDCVMAKRIRNTATEAGMPADVQPT